MSSKGIKSACKSNAVFFAAALDLGLDLVALDCCDFVADVGFDSRLATCASSSNCSCCAASSSRRCLWSVLRCFAAREGSSVTRVLLETLDMHAEG